MPRAEVPRPYWLQLTWEDGLVERYYYPTQESRDQAHARYSRDTRIKDRERGKD